MTSAAALRHVAPATSLFGPNFDRLAEDFCQAGYQKLMIITDFDQTLTRYVGSDGLPGDQCHQIVMKHLDTTLLPEVGAIFRDLNAWDRLTEAQRMEKCNQDPEQRVAATRSWFKSFHEASSQHQLSQFASPCLLKSNVCTRQNLSATFDWIKKWNVPLFLISAGIRELLVPILRTSTAELPSTARLVANSLDEPDVSITSHDNADGLTKIPDFSALAAGKTHALLLGDKPSDCAPLRSLPPEVVVLKVAFLHEPSKAVLAEYSQHFDVLLTGDPSMDFVNALLDLVSGQGVSPRL
mmetsp:Transcript_17217/g.35470  ORF Transcript_17217/g.35470 Transcript_17217/m.35470 type:complete len:296 (+) Transcript_17217:25-912(+)